MKKIGKIFKGCVVFIFTLVIIFIFLVIFAYKTEDDNIEDFNITDTLSLTATSEFVFDYKVKVGDKIKFGIYPYPTQSHEDSEMITWIVIDRNDDTATLITEKVIETLPFDKNGGVSWGDSSLRWWLNGEFYENAFSEKEKQYIIDTFHDNNNDNFVDKLYLMKYDHAYEFFIKRPGYKAKHKKDPTNYRKYMLPKGTDYVCSKAGGCQSRVEEYHVHHITSSDEENYSTWWIMPDYNYSGIIYNYVDRDGRQDAKSFTLSDGVRPVMVIKELPKD